MRPDGCFLGSKGCYGIVTFPSLRNIPRHDTRVPLHFFTIPTHETWRKPSESDYKIDMA